MLSCFLSIDSNIYICSITADCVGKVANGMRCRGGEFGDHRTKFREIKERDSRCCSALLRDRPTRYCLQPVSERILHHAYTIFESFLFIYDINLGNECSLKSVKLVFCMMLLVMGI